MDNDNRAVEQLAQTRRELRALLQPESRQRGQFPRSATMRFLASGEGGSVAAALLGSLLLRRVPLARSLVKLLPMNSILGLLRRMPRS